MDAKKKKLSTAEKEELLQTLEDRFKKHKERHPELKWEDVLKKLEENPEKLESLHVMERTGGAPDVVFHDKEKDIYTFMDCSRETPEGRRSICFDEEALEKRKKNKPETSVEKMAEDMGVELLSEEEYRMLQDLGEFDTKTSSWIRTPEAIRKSGGALFGDRRYDAVFIYHNGADSYYGARGFRGSLKV
ncbi:DUF4256 domain-containing protein [Proteiniclasticum sp. C24MP]|uniref:DUF4256 domain-containing protein n=1 Tax=Proteiniclasticum sp. C24MP TaxID=3374101 RepID=UPI00375439AD